MKHRGIAAIALLAAASAAWGGVINGDFSSTTARPNGTLAPDGWQVSVLPSNDLSLASQTVVEAYMDSLGVLKCYAANSYFWDEEWECWEAEESYGSVVNVEQWEIVAPAGTDALEFRAAAFYQDAEIFAHSRTEPSVMVSAVYETIGGLVMSPFLIIGDADWANVRSIPLPGLNPALTVQLKLFVTSKRSEYEPHVEGVDTKNVTVTAYADDFAFVPEPATLTLLALGVVALWRRR